MEIKYKKYNNLYRGFWEACILSTHSRSPTWMYFQHFGISWTLGPWEVVEATQGQSMSEMFFGIEPQGIELLESMLTLEPADRINAKEAMGHTLTPIFTRLMRHEDHITQEIWFKNCIVDNWIAFNDCHLCFLNRHVYRLSKPRTPGSVYMPRWSHI